MKKNQKKSIIAAILAAAVMTEAAVSAYAAGSDLQGCGVTVTDPTTPAVMAFGKDWPITRWYFYSGDGRELGSISGQAVLQIAARYSDPSIQWETWLAESFNQYRMEAGGATAPTTPAEEKKEPQGGSTEPIQMPVTAFDAEEAAMEVIRLVNEQRAAHGLAPYEMDEDLMELAAVRAEETSRKYSHVRPDGTRVSQTYGYGENVGARTSAERQVTSWMNSPGHRSNILIDWCGRAGAGCYRAENGSLRWVLLIAK